MRRTKVRLFSFALLMVALMVVVPVALAGNDFVIGELRVDLSSVTTGQYLNYRHYVYPAAAPNNPTGTVVEHCASDTGTGA
jgi:hypothetical protein